MKKLTVTTTKKAASSQYQKLFLYGLPGSGKTHFAGTFPLPLFISSKATVSELQTHSDQEISVVTFTTVQDFVDTIQAVYETMMAGKPIGDYIPKTIIIDNITEIQNLIQHEMLHDDETKKGNQAHGQKVMSDRDWGVLRDVLMHARVQLYKLSHLCHIIWIGHAQVREREVAKGEKKQYGTWVIKGDAYNFIPNSCTIVAYMQAVPRLGGRVEYYLHGSPYDIWNSRVQFPSSKGGFLKIGGTDSKDPGAVHPHYNDLAPYFDLPLLDEAEEGYDWNKEEK